MTDSSPSPRSNSNPALTIAEPVVLRYGNMAILLHWLLVPLMVVTFCAGLYMTELAFSPARIRLYNWHKWAGVTILTLSVLRLLWRLVNPPPALSARMQSVMPPWQRKAHRSTHALLYVLFFAVPLLGWAYSSAAGFQVVWFGALPLPDFVAVNRDFADAVLKPAHRASAFLLAAVVLVHVGAALKHHFIDRDGLLARMWFAPRTESSP